MLPTGLFIESPEMEDISRHKLSQNMDDWPEEIVQKLKEKVPQSSSLTTIVKFMKKDEENGAGTGSIVISSASKKAVIPVIVREFSMYPLDIMIYEGRVLPLTEEYFAKSFDDNSAFESLEEFPTYGGINRFQDADLWNSAYPPNLGRYSYASAGHEILESIADTINPAEFKAYLIENPSIAYNFKKHGQAEIVKALSNLKPVNMNEFRQGADNLIPRSFHVLRKEAPNKYTILSNSDEVFAPQIHPNLDRKSAEEFLSKICQEPQDEINDVDQNGEKILIIKEPIQDNAQLAVPDSDQIDDAKEFACYVVKKKNGVSVEGYVIPKVIDFNMEIKPLRIFLGKTMATIQPSIGGKILKNSSWTMKKMEQEPRVGQTGTFVYSKGPQALGTIPVTIRSVAGTDAYNLSMTVMTLGGETLKIKLSQDNELSRIAYCNDRYLLPKGFKWYPMEGFHEVSNTPDDYIMKTAGLQLTSNPVKVMSTGYGQYSVKGLSKYASAMNWDETNLDSYKVKFLLASLSVGNEKIARTLAHADRTSKAELHGVNRPLLKSEKIAKMLPLARKMQKFAESIKSNLVKEASYFENSQTVDALLSLNFANTENVAKFVAYLPAFKACISNLCSCLLASRIGIDDIPEQACASAIHRLLDVVTGLEGLRATQEHGDKK